MSRRLGYGEVGLPPKKPGVYYADLGDCLCFAGHVLTELKQLAAGSIASSPPRGLEVTRGVSGSDTQDEPAESAAVYEAIIAAVDLALDAASVSDAGAGAARAAASGWEAAILDGWSFREGQAIHRLLQLLPPPRGYDGGCSGYYTAALSDDVTEMVKSALFGLTVTPFLKVKVNADVTTTAIVLSALKAATDDWAAAAGGGVRLPGKRWSIDANAAWTPEIAQAQLEALLPYADLIYMVEQPFPVTIPAGDLGAWRRIRSDFNAAGLLVFADESVKTAADVDGLVGLCDGVNVKLEKAGGLRAGIAALAAAKAVGLRVWLGCMVGSTLNSATAAQLCGLVPHADLDGSLLITSESDLFAGGGFEWGVAGAPVGSKTGGGKRCCSVAMWGTIVLPTDGPHALGAGCPLRSLPDTQVKSKE